MAHERRAHALRSAADRAAAARRLLHIGPWGVRVTVVAWGLSAILHGGLLATSYFLARRYAPDSNPNLSFARGDQATRIQVLLVPRPDPAEEEETKTEPLEVTSATESPAAADSAEEVEVVHPPENHAPDDGLDPSAVTTEARDVPDDDAPNADEGLAIEEVREDARTDKPVEATRHTPSVEAILGRLIRELERLLAQPETGPRVDRRLPPPAAHVEGSVTAPIEETVRSNASSAQTAGIETGVETLDLPTPKYPSLSRRRGEEGLVLLQVEVLPDGRVGDITVIDDAGFRRLAEAAVAAARKGRFQPATRDGHPIRATVRIPFRFVLR